MIFILQILLRILSSPLDITIKTLNIHKTQINLIRLVNDSFITHGGGAGGSLLISKIRGKHHNPILTSSSRSIIRFSFLNNKALFLFLYTLLLVILWNIKFTIVVDDFPRTINILMCM
ncbi:hypothetical protein ACB098_08G000800 [Castanea mollissima]